jgi:flagellar protein FlgJ
MYENYNDSIRDYISLVRDNPRYSSAINSGSDIGAFGEGLMKGGYATDPAYAKKLANVVIAMREH